MAWNPSPEVAAARDAAKALKADRVLMFFIRPDGKAGFASYGETKQKCGQVGRVGNAVWDEVLDAFVNVP